MDSAQRNGSRIKGRKRVLVYSHDTYGLGHLRRCVLIARGLAPFSEIASILIATGSPRADAFVLPQGCDTIKLPAVTKAPNGRYRSRTLRMPFEETARIRGAVLRAASRSFRPDLILVDHAPLGMGGELRPLLEDLMVSSRRPRLVLGLRDIIDEAAKVKEEWDRLGAWDFLDSYDRILVYGDPSVLTTAQEMDLPRRFAGKVRMVGYLGRPFPFSGQPDPMILVTAGGGGDGQNLLRSYAAFLESLPGTAPFRSVVVTGPFMSPRRRAEITARLQALRQPIDVVTFTDRFEELLAGTKGVVSMAGYNTTVEILSAGTPALLLPRESPRREQWIRAERLARVADVEFCRSDSCDPSRIGRFVQRVLKQSARRPASVRLDGVQRTAEQLLGLLASAGRPRDAPVSGRDRVRALA
jgi:predicted glycosyltransferase